MDIRRIGRLVGHLKMAAFRDTENLIKYRGRAPYWAEPITVPTRKVRRITREFKGDESSGLVVAGGWHERATCLDEDLKFGFCLQHWSQGVSWEDAGVFEFFKERIAIQGSYDGCRSMEDVKKRYANLDAIFMQVRDSGRLKSYREVAPRATFRALGDIRIHVGPGAEPIFGGAGVHRLAMAKIAEVDSIPARIGVIHPSAIPDWCIFRARS